MAKYLAVACIVFGSLSLMTEPSSAQSPGVAGQSEIADTVGQLFSGIAEATTALDLDRLLGYYEESETLTYVAQGSVIRSHEAFREVMNARLGGLGGADLRWLDTYIDVLSTDVAVATATYEFIATFQDGQSVNSTGTYTCIYVRHEGRWQVRYSAHSFPPPPADRAQDR